MKHFTILYLTIGIALSVGTSCSRNRELLRSFENISAGHTKEGRFKISQNRTMAINGQLPFTDIGSAFLYRPRRGNFASIGILWNDEPQTQHRSSHELVQTYESFADEEKILELRDAILGLSEAAADVTLLSHLVLDEDKGLRTARKRLDELDVVLNRTKRTREQLENELNSKRQELQIAEENEAQARTEESIKLKAVEVATLDLDAAVGDSVRSEKERAQEKAEKQAKDANRATVRASKVVERASKTVELATAKLELAQRQEALEEDRVTSHQAAYEKIKGSVTEAQENLAAARKNAETFRGSAISLMREQNLFIFRWNADKKKLGLLTLTNRNYARYKRELGRTGFVIMSGMRSRKLFLSQDDAAKLEAFTHEQHFSEILPLRPFQFLLPFHHGNDIQIVTHLVETQSEAYVSEQSLNQAAKIQVNASELSDKDAEILRKAALEAATSALENLANAGTIAPPKLARKPVMWPWDEPRSIEAYASADPWIPVMAVTTRLSDLDDIFRTRTARTYAKSRPETPIQPIYSN